MSRISKVHRWGRKFSSTPSLFPIPSPFPILLHRPRRGFTLIELLIVVAIIAILAAIAVPNFLEAQVRAKVSATSNDLRTISTALEAYRVDENRYPPAEFSQLFGERLDGLTTPVAYMTSMPRDPFYRSSGVAYGAQDPNYCYAPGNVYANNAPIFNTTQYRNTIYSIAGRGPDAELFFGAYCMAHPLAQQNKSHIIGQYDPTNGTVSAGDVIRLGGSSLR